MVITRTPFRISFFGGGTDYPSWYSLNGGQVLSTSIDKYCYITCRKLPQFFDHKHRIVYSMIENVKKINDIQHPSVRAVLEWANIEEGLEIHHDGDLPARSGLGSSSAFTVGLINAIKAHQGTLLDKRILADNAINIEQNMLSESVGSQDQIATAFGGLNHVIFSKNKTYEVNPLIISVERQLELNSHLMLFFTGLSRTANEIAKSKIENFDHKILELKNISNLVDEAIKVLTTNSLIEKFGELLDESWRIKRNLSDKVSNTTLDKIYSDALSAGAIGGKILGAGGGGFMLLFAKPEKHDSIRLKLNHLINVSFKFETEGSRIVLFQPNGF
jgi:D-glycero-alpha-D-manno-heptose-7-phosphate kinase